MLKLVCLALLISCAFGTDYITGNFHWNVKTVVARSNLADAFMIAQDLSTHTDLVDNWFYMYVNGQYTQGRSYQVMAGLGGAYYVFDQAPTVLSNLLVSGTLRIDSSGWAVKLTEFRNPQLGPITVTVSNNLKGDLGSGATTLVYTTSDGDNAVTAADVWTITSDGTAGAPGGQDPIAAAAFGYVDSFSLLNSDKLQYSKSFVVPPGQTVGFLEVLGCIDPTLPLSNAANLAHNFLDNAVDLYNYVNPVSGFRLLDHLTSVQLARVVNWSFGAVVGGDPHGVDFSGRRFDLPHSESTYCLFHDRSLQVNVHVGGNMALISEVVVFVREQNLVIHAGFTEDSAAPVYTVNHRTVSVPDSAADGFITTESGPFSFFGPLGEFSRYQENLISIGNYVTIVGGWHPGGGGFFNIVVTHKSDEVTFPSILQLLSLNREGDRSVGSEFYSSVIPDVWFSA